MTTTTTVSSSKGSPIDDPGSDDSNTKDTISSTNAQDDEDDPFTFRSRKSYPQRNNRPKLNYRDLERGVYDAYEIRQSMWALGGPSALNNNNRTGKHSNNTEYSDDEDLPTDEENDEILMETKDKSNDESDQKHRRLWCICKKPWDHSRLMLRCDTCANWYHGDCIGVTKEQARILDMNGDQFVCPPCQKVATNAGLKPGRSSDESVMIKRKRIDVVSPSDRRVENVPPSKNLTQSEPSKRPKTGIFFHRDSSANPQIHCIVHGCSNWAKPGWVYCSAACIRRHINDTLQAIQRSKGTDNDIPPSREDILLYESRTKKVLDRKLVPKVEDLCSWINQHPSYEIVKPALRQSILLTANESKSSSLPSSQPALIRSPSVVTPKTPTTPTSSKPKLSWAPVVPNTKPVPIKKAPVQIGKPTTNTSSSSSSSTIQNYADIRMKVPQALYDKLIMRLEKSGEKSLPNDDIRILCDKIEEEMYRVYGKVDNAYKNKFRSLLANVNNMNNNFFYKHILTKEVTAKQIVAMKPEDMLPPEEKEKRKDEFEKEVQMIIKAGEQSAEELARRARVKNTRQGLVDNDAILHSKEQSAVVEEKVGEPKSETTTKKPTENNTTPKPKKPNPTTDKKPVVKPKPKVQSKPVAANKDTPTPIVNKDTTSSHGRHTFDINCSICVNPPETKTSISVPTETLPPQPSEPLPTKSSAEPPKLRPASPVREEPNPMFSSVDIDNDYIEPESPTGIDALLYDDDDDLNNSTNNSRPKAIQQQTSHPESPSDNHEYRPPANRDDYNPLTATKPKTDTPSIYQPTPVSRPLQQWRGVIIPPDGKLSCQSVRMYGESDYLIDDIPEQLTILGRLRLADLWDYVRGSLPVRDVIILTVTSSNSTDNTSFLRYVETIRTSGRAAVINKPTEPSAIRDMYVLAADMKDCPTAVQSTLSLSTTIDSKQLFLVVIGSGKRTTKNSSQLTYKPVSLQDTTMKRDPRLLRNKDPRLAASNVPETTPKLIPTQLSTEDLLKTISESIERIHQTSSSDARQSMIISTMEFLKNNQRDDLCKQFADEITKLTNANNTSEDNLNEESMEVDDEQDDRHKKSLIISEFNDVDYRFLDQDMDHRIPPILAQSSVDPRTINSSLKEQNQDQRTTYVGNDSDFRINDVTIQSP